MKPAFTLLTALLGVALFSSCKTTRVLNATFESDVIGSPPAKNPAGEPAGDSVTYSGPLQPRLRVQASATAGQKVLQFGQNSASGLTAHNEWVTFQGISANFAQPLWFYYTATLRGSGGGMTIDVSDGTAKVIARMTISSNGQVSLVRNSSFLDKEVVGTIPLDVAHTVVFSVNMSKSTYNLTIIKSGGNLTATDKPVILGSGLEYSNPARPSISFRYDDGDSDGRRYLLESVTISRKKPD